MEDGGKKRTDLVMSMERFGDSDEAADNRQNSEADEREEHDPRGLVNAMVLGDLAFVMLGGAWLGVMVGFAEMVCRRQRGAPKKVLNHRRNI